MTVGTDRMVCEKVECKYLGISGSRGCKLMGNRNEYPDKIEWSISYEKIPKDCPHKIIMIVTSQRKEQD